MLLEKDMDQIIIDSNKIINKPISVDWDFCANIRIILILLFGRFFYADIRVLRSFFLVFYILWLKMG